MPKSTYGEAPLAESLAQDLASLRQLALQLRRMAATADDQVLRAILGRREALLDSIRTRLAASETPLRAATAEGEALCDGAQTFAEVVREIAEMDRLSGQVLKQRAEETAAEIAKLRAGKKWRESNQS